jgi:Predicted membrane protein (DUF2207)
VAVRYTRTAATLFGLLGLATALLLAGSGSAAAAEDGSGHVTTYAVDLRVRPDGALEVQERIVYVFDDQGHGIERYIPVRYRYDDTHDRVVDVTDVRASSDSGAPVDLLTEEQGGDLYVRIGDPDQLVSGTQSYQLAYTVEGALNDREDHVELAWNAIGDRWETSIEQATMTVTAPALQRARCFYGPTGSDDSCGSTTLDGVAGDGEATVDFGPVSLQANEGMTVYADLPQGSVDVAPSMLVERWTPQRAFSVTPLTVGLAAVLAGLGGLAVRRLAVRRGRDEQSVTALHATSAAGPVAGVPVDWRAIREMPPGVLGTLVDEKADVVDVTATIVDLAVRRHLRIEELEERRWKVWDWLLTRLDEGPDDLAPYESRLLGELFSSGSSVRISDLQDSFHEQMASLRNDLYDEVVRRGWYRVRPDRTRLLWYSVGVVALMLTAGVAVLLAVFTTFGLVGLALVMPALGLLLAAGAMPARTAEGSAALQQVHALRDYLATSTPQQARWEDTEQTFSTLVPYAMVLGLEKRWAEAFAPLAARPSGEAGGSYGYAPYWYLGVPAGLHADGIGGLGSALSSFASTAGSAMSSSPSTSSGGGSGGGGGGGGGGGW